MTPKEIHIARAKVKQLLQELRKRQCTNFRVVGYSTVRALDTIKKER